MGYTGPRPAKGIIYAGLKRLEYRGYDSVGIVVMDKQPTSVKAVGDTSKLDITDLPDQATIGIGHTRWATHGKPSATNAHPHTYGKITLVHNGIIENFREIAEQIGAKPQSQTDSEILAALIDHYYIDGSGNLLEAVQSALAEVKGTFGIAVVTPDLSNTIVVARRGSPLVIGVGNGQHYIASDPSAIIDHTDKVIYLEDDQIAAITPEVVDLYDLKLQSKQADIMQIDKAQAKAELGSYGSYLEKEIFEQPDSLRNLMRGRVGGDGMIKLGGPNLSQTDIENIKRIVIVGCGSAYFAGLNARYILEEMIDIPVSVEHANEFRYRYGSYVPEETLAIFMSQSGETADVLASLSEAKRRGIKNMGIVNAIGSTLAREVDNGGIYLHAGVEVSVASTKAYSSMVVALLMLGGYFAHALGLNTRVTRELAQELLSLPGEIENVLALKPQIDKVATKLAEYDSWFYLGRGSLYTIALEGALKLTELTYTSAQGIPMGEMKHGLIAMVNPNHVSVVLLPEDKLLYEKGLSSLEEVKSRQGVTMTISTRPKPAGSDYHIQLSHLGEKTDGLLMNICLQLLALRIATIKKVNIDRPRNLAKSVTVE